MLIVLLAALVIAEGHIGSVYMLEGCGSCHVGHGISNEPMLAKSEENHCYQCHGSAEKRSVMIADGKLASSARLGDLEAVMDKAYRHPVEDGFGHTPDEILPRPEGAAASHAECVDCHDPHLRGSNKVRMSANVSGYSLSGQVLQRATQEYEVCLKCHGDNEGRRDPEKNIRKQFSASVRSMHPVSRPPVGRGQTSLLASAQSPISMTCSSCHTNDDPDGPRGPHGSNYKYLLSGNYNTDVYATESLFAYEFCYSCHDRSSILNNESFKLHSEHILGDPLTGRSGTSCYSCHSGHGSERHNSLIRFNANAVTRSINGNLLTYISNGSGSGECYLTCHKHSHEPGKY